MVCVPALMEYPAGRSGPVRGLRRAQDLGQVVHGEPGRLGLIGGVDQAPVSLHRVVAEHVDERVPPVLPEVREVQAQQQAGLVGFADRSVTLRRPAGFGHGPGQDLQ